MAKEAFSMDEYYKKLQKEDKDAIVNLKERTPIDFIPTGSWVVNTLIGDGTLQDKPGGLPRGHVVEIRGNESSGKTTLLLSAIRQAQEMGGACLLLDFEQTFHSKYAENLGVSLDKKKLLVAQPMHFQQGARMIKDALSAKPWIIGVDSVAAMTPKEVFEGKIDEGGRIGLHAQLMSAFLQIITKYLKEANTCLVFNNQLRNIIKASKYDKGPDKESTGGNALRYYASVRIDLEKGYVERVERISAITGKKEKEPVNVTSKVSIIKNKIDKPFKQAPIFIKFGEGIDNIMSIIELAVNLGVIKQSGAFYTFSQGNEQVLKCQGKQALWKELNENAKSFKLLQSHLVISKDAQVEERYKDEQDSPPADEMDQMLENVASTYVEKKKRQKEATAE